MKKWKQGGWISIIIFPSIVFSKNCYPFCKSILGDPHRVKQKRNFLTDVILVKENFFKKKVDYTFQGISLMPGPFTTKYFIN